MSPTAVRCWYARHNAALRHKPFVLSQTWFSYGLGTIWDSGTTFSYFTRNVYNALVAAIRRHVEANPDLVSVPGAYVSAGCRTRIRTASGEGGPYARVMHGHARGRVPSIAAPTAACGFARV